MNVFVQLRFDYDARTWADEYGLAESEAPAHFATLLRRAVRNGHLAGILDEGWPMMRGHVTAHAVDALDTATRDELLHVLRDEHDADITTALITEITERLAEDLPAAQTRTPRWVVFGTSEWDNGYFLTGDDAAVYFDDGDQMPFDFQGSHVDDLLTALYGICGQRAALGVDLREKTLEFDYYSDNVPRLLGIPPLQRHDSDADTTSDNR